MTAKNRHRIAQTAAMAAIAAMLLALGSCIKPPLNLAAESVVIDLPIVDTELEVVWNIDTDLEKDWYYGWDDTDKALWGDIGYTSPTNYEVRRYYLGQQPGGAHTADGYDAFTIFSNRFRRTYNFGYYDLLVWSNIDSPDGTQVLIVNDRDLDEVTASTTITRGLARDPQKAEEITALYNQPEIFYSAYPRDIFISHKFEDYDYYDEEQKAYVKNIKATLNPLVYIYLVQIVLHNNDGRIVGTLGDGAVSAFATSTSVNTGHTGNTPCMVYYGTRYKAGCIANGETVDVIGGKLTTFGLCDMDPFWVNPKAEYTGSRGDLPNYLYFTLRFANGTSKTMVSTVTDQCRKQSHGGIITLHLDCRDIEVPDPGSGGGGGAFIADIEDYEDVIYDIPM